MLWRSLSKILKFDTVSLSGAVTEWSLSDNYFLHCNGQGIVKNWRLKNYFTIKTNLIAYVNRYQGWIDRSRYKWTQGKCGILGGEQYIASVQQYNLSVAIAVSAPRVAYMPVSPLSSENLRII